jgi:hypothetical protein
MNVHVLIMMYSNMFRVAMIRLGLSLSTMYRYVVQDKVLRKYASGFVTFHMATMVPPAV